MRIIRTRGRRGHKDILWCVGGVASFVSLEDAVDLAFDAHADQIAQAPQRTLWTVYGGAA